MRDRWAATIAVVAATFLLTTAPATALEATSEEVRALAARADDDPAAYASLLEIDRVDGQPVDLRTALADARGDERTSRLEVLARSGPGTAVPVDAGDAREDAADILSGRKYRPPEVPRPFRGAVRQIGRWIEPLLDPFAPVGRFFTTRLGMGVAVVLVAAAAYLLSVRLLRRRARGAAASGAGGARHRREDPARLEREAAEAEAAGDLERALRLRFRAGLLRLDERGVVRYRPSLRSRDLDVMLHSPTFLELARSFDEVVYGGRPAGATDVDAARTGWPRVLEEVGGR